MLVEARIGPYIQLGHRQQVARERPEPRGGAFEAELEGALHGRLPGDGIQQPVLVGNLAPQVQVHLGAELRGDDATPNALALAHERPRAVELDLEGHDPAGYGKLREFIIHVSRSASTVT